MDKFDALLNIAERLLGPQGCPWDQKQTFLSLQPYVLEEAHEVVEAVDSNEDEKIIEELGDLLYTVVFYSKLAEKSGRFSILEIIESIQEKLIRRHPHVFAELKVEGMEEVAINWEKIKAKEKGNKNPRNAFEGIPPTLPSLIRAQKIIKKMQRAGSLTSAKQDNCQEGEKEIGEQLLDLVIRAENSHVDAESALRRALARLEDTFKDTAS